MVFAAEVKQLQIGFDGLEQSFDIRRDSSITAQQPVPSKHPQVAGASDRIDRRLALALVRFAERFGKPQEDGGLKMEPLTHELLAQYVGTSRELITCHMAKLRQLGMLQYSRRSIVVYRHAMRDFHEIGERLQDPRRAG